MSQFSVVTDVGSVSAYPTAPQVTVPFVPDWYVFRCETGTPGLMVSFDGANDHLHIKANDTPILFPAKTTKVWLKEDGAGVSTWRTSALSNS